MKSRSFLAWLALSALIASAATAAPPEWVLFDFSRKMDPVAWQTNNARADQVQASGGLALRVTTGHTTQWPGITLDAPKEPWDLSPYASVELALRNPSGIPVTVNCRVDNGGADGVRHCVTGSLKLEAGAAGLLKVPLKRSAGSTLDGKLFGLRGYPHAMSSTGAVDAGRITQLLLFVTKPANDQAFEVTRIRAQGAYTPPTAWVTDASPYFPFIDTLGQYQHKEWPGKVRSLEELSQRRLEEAKELAARPGPRDWDKYGGWSSGPKLKATGFFRAEKHRGKWWLVDPDGHLFFSQGLDCVRMLDATPIDERETWFADFPGRDKSFQEFLGSGFALKGHYAGRSPRTFSFAGANLKRKYGADWREIFAALAHQRLRSWGLNTIANWSEQSVYLLRRTPYTDTVGSRGAKMIEGSAGYWGKFPDVFDETYPERVRRGVEARRGRSAGDPWCLGYFSDNEMSWGDDVSLAVAALKSPPEQAAKKAFLGDLKTKYGDIARLNAAWGTTHESWEAMLASRAAPDAKKAREDLQTFYTRTAERYFWTVREAIKAVAPNQLYLGCRFAWVNDRAAAASAKYCDVVSYNLYRRSVADFKFNGGADVPLIIGEFHFGGLDRGMFHTGLVPVANQAERAQAYTDYVRGALRHPQFVGCHWFQYQDEPTTGRVYDEENYQIGFVDIADTPYVEMVAASRALARDLYSYRLEN